MMEKIYMSLLVYKHLEELFQLLITHAKSLFTCCHLIVKQ